MPGDEEMGKEMGKEMSEEMVVETLRGCRIASALGRSGGALRAAALPLALAAALVAPGVAPGAALAQQAPANTEPGRLIVPLSGSAIVQRNGNLEASPARVDTGLVEIGDEEPIAITLTHGGGAGSDPVTIDAATLIGKSAEEYTSDFAGVRTLYPGESLPVGITFTPRTPGAKSAGLRLDIAGASAPYVVLLDGRSRFPLSSDLELLATTLAFGQTNTDTTAAGTFVLENTGEAESPAIDVTAIELSGDTPQDFSVAFAPTTLAPGETLEVSASMSSSLAGTKSAVATVHHDGNNPPVELGLEGEVVAPMAVPVSFALSTLDTDQPIEQGTTLQFGPDGNLYVGEMKGAIHVFAVTREGDNAYVGTRLERIDLIEKVPNHDDDGSPNPNQKGRLMTGIHVSGTAAQPVIYAASSDPRYAAGPSPNDPDGNDVDLDTNSGILHRLTKAGGGWSKEDLVRGLPRSEENHVANGLILDGDKILIVTGGNTNQGAPSTNFAQLPEYALSAAVLEIDLGQIDGTYDLPTLDDEDRPGVDDANDPFGGNDGKNQAKLVAGGPVRIHASGLRNAYDLVLTESGKLYTFDNGPNSPWGGVPNGDCANESVNGGETLPDSLHLVTEGAHLGHPNPTRGNKANTFNASNPQSPIEVAANPIECQYEAPGQNGSLTTISSSTNGLDEYTASNFGGAMKGDLVAASHNKKVFRMQLDGAGNQVTSKSTITPQFGSRPLDIVAQGDGGPFPGTIWVVDNDGGDFEGVFVLEPADY